MVGVYRIQEAPQALEKWPWGSGLQCTEDIFGKPSSGHRMGKGQLSFQSQRKAIPKNAQTTTQLHSSHATKVELKIL